MTKNFSKVTLNNFNSFRLSNDNKLVDMMDANAQIEFQKQTLERIQRNFTQKKLSLIMKSEEKQDNTKKICCNCKKSKCLKLYCECFAANKFCEGCNCQNCSNQAENVKERDSVISSLLMRNPNAFKPKLQYEEVFYFIFSNLKNSFYSQK